MGEDGRRVAPVTAWGVVDFVAAIGLAVHRRLSQTALTSRLQERAPKRGKNVTALKN